MARDVLLVFGGCCSGWFVIVGGVVVSAASSSKAFLGGVTSRSVVRTEFSGKGSGSCGGGDDRHALLGGVLFSVSGNRVFVKYCG